MATQLLPAHRWYTPADCAALLLGMRHGDTWRAPCPVHGGDSTDCLSIREGKDRYGHPMTLLHCFAHDCAIEDICAALGIVVRNLFCMTPEYYRTMQRFPPVKSPRLARLGAMDEPTPDQVAQTLLEEMIVSDPAWIATCKPARQKMWALAQEPYARAAFTRALLAAQIPVKRFWETLSDAYSERGTHDD